VGEINREILFALGAAAGHFCAPAVLEIIWELTWIKSSKAMRPYESKVALPPLGGTPIAPGAGGVLDFGGTSCVLSVEAEYEWVGVVMAEDFDNRNVMMVAAIIGGAVLLLGFGGALFLIL
jgi:hypothetical protein